MFREEKQSLYAISRELKKIYKNVIKICNHEYVQIKEFELLFLSIFN